MVGGGGQKLGQRQGFSQLDVEKLNKLYECRQTEEDCYDTLKRETCVALDNDDEACSRFPKPMSILCSETCRLCTISLAYVAATAGHNDDDDNDNETNETTYKLTDKPASASDTISNTRWDPLCNDGL